MKLRMLSVLSVIIAIGIKSMNISAKDYHEFRILANAIPESPYIPTPLPIALENRLDSIVFTLSQASAVKDMYINLNDSLTPQFEIFQELQYTANETELNDLLLHDSPVVRVYSYRALIVNNMNLNCDYEMAIMEDTTCIDLFAGSELTNTTVKDQVQRDLYAL